MKTGKPPALTTPRASGGTHRHSKGNPHRRDSPQVNGTTAVQDRPQAATDGSAGLKERLEAWIDAEGIEGHYDTAGIASRLVASLHKSNLERWLNQGSSDYLRHACENHKDEADLTDAEWAAENYRHGHLAEDTRGAA